jgi:hypothetical protein
MQNFSIAPIQPEMAVCGVARDAMLDTDWYGVQVSYAIHPLDVGVLVRWADA